MYLPCIPQPIAPNPVVAQANPNNIELKIAELRLWIKLADL